MALPAAGTLPLADYDDPTDSDVFAAATKQIATELEALKGTYDAASGLIVADSDGNVPASALSGATIVPLLLAHDGAGTGLDADKLDGFDAADFLRSDGSQTLSLASDKILTLDKATAATDVVHTVLSLRGNASGRGAGYGVSMLLRASNASGTLTDAGKVAALWDTATAAAEDSRIELSTMVAGTLTPGVAVVGGALEMVATSSPSTTPDAGSNLLWFDDASGTLKIRPGSGASDITVGTSAGVPSHNHDGSYLELDGTSAMTGTLDVADNLVLISPVTPPGNPTDANDLYIYNDGGVLKTRNSAGTVITVSNTPSLHADFSDLSGNHHPQYALVQPTANVTINAAGNDYDWTFKDGAGGSAIDILKLDAGHSAVGLGGATISADARLFVESTGSRSGIKATVIDGTGFEVVVGDGTGLDATSLGDGLLGNFIRTSVGSTSSAVVRINEAGVSASGQGALLVQNTGATVGSYSARFEFNAIEALSVNDTELVINDSAHDYDFRVEGDTAPHLLRTIASSDVVTINHETLATGRLNVDGGALDAIFARTGQSGKFAIRAEGTSSAGGLSLLTASGTALDAECGSTGKAGYFHRDQAAATGELVLIEAVDAADSGALLKIKQAGVGRMLEVEEDSTYTVGLISSSGASEIAGIIELRMFGSGATIPNAASDYLRLFGRDGKLWANFEGTEVEVGTGAGGGSVTTAGGVTSEVAALEGTITTVASQAFVDTTIQLPIGAVIIDVIAKTVAVVSGGYDVGEEGDTTRYGEGISGALPSNNLALDRADPVRVAPGMTNRKIRVTSGNPSGFVDNTGQVQISIIYRQSSIA